MNPVADKPEDRLFRVAATQQGHFTTAQAIAAGYQDATHAYHVRVGNWIREWRGVYRLARYPLTEDGQYVLWSLWSRSRAGTPEGVYSHETALSIYELADAMPEKLHMTVPPSFRRHARIPSVLVLHIGTVALEETEEREGYRVTNPARTLVDLVLEETTAPEVLRQACRESQERGLLTHASWERYRQDKGIWRKVQQALGDSL
jgi:predicted transcriptional regulator of viral defense system